MEILSTLNGGNGEIIVSDVGIVIKRSSLFYQLFLSFGNTQGRGMRVMPDIVVFYPDLESVSFSKTSLFSYIKILPKRKELKFTDLQFSDDRKYTVNFNYLEKLKLQQAFDLIYSTWQANKEKTLSEEDTTQLKSLATIHDSKNFDAKWLVIQFVYIICVVFLIVGGTFLYYRYLRH